MDKFRDKVVSPKVFPLLGWLVVALCTLNLTACSVLADLAPSKNPDVNVRNWLVVPVFYATNRDKEPGSQQFAYNERLSARGRSFGVKNIVVPQPENVALSRETVEKMGWQILHLEELLPPGDKPAVPDKCKVSDREMSAHEIIDAFDNYRKDSGSDQVIVFVHGCCATFDTSLYRAAKIAANLQIPLVIYDWVSPTGFTHYLANETMAEQELDDFHDFLKKTELIVPTSKTMLMGHSMGAKFLDSALVRRAERNCAGVDVPRYQEVIFSNPDIDAKSYINHNREVASNADKIRIYMVMNDGRLRTSARAHGGYPRLGLPGELMPDICRVDRQDVIDVTALDSGHEVPFWVVADMHRSGKPSRGSGFDLEETKPHLFVLRKKNLGPLK